MSYLAAAIWVKNEGSYLKEWIDFHTFQGVDKIYVYDNNSTDDTLDVLKPYISTGVVEIRYYPDTNMPRKNFWVMDTTINEFKGIHKWLFHPSVDEYWFCPNGMKLSSFLKTMEQYPGIVVPWRNFNSGGQKTRIPGRVIDRFTTYTDDPNYHIRTIVQPEHTINSVGNPHAYNFNRLEHVYSDGTIAHRISHSGANQHSNNYDLDTIRINHYLCMSEEEYINKMNKGLLDFGTIEENNRRSDTDERWIYEHSREWKTDTILMNYKTEITSNG